jgi:formylglycine-generating enzyme required for sulfatase activity
MPNHRLSAFRNGHRWFTLSVPWLLLVFAGCSFKSLDYLQGGERPGDDEPTGGTNSGGRSERTSMGGADPAGGGASADAGRASTSMGGETRSTTSGSAGNASVGGRDPANSAGSLPNFGGSTGDAHFGGASVGGQISNGGTQVSTNIAAGGVTPAAGGGVVTSSLSGGSAGGPNMTIAVAGSAGSSATTNHAGSAGRLNHGGSAGVAAGSALAGSLGTAGAAGSSVAPGMQYNVQGQSCGTGLTCPTSASCCARIAIPGGSFSMGTSNDASRNLDESPAHTATLDGFVLDKFEVTVGRFRNFMAAYDGTKPPSTGGAHPKLQNSGWQAGWDANLPASKAALQSAVNCNVGQYQTWTETVGVRETMPINCVSWYVAFAFCVWDGGRLPTEAEWEMAASNANSETRFPWGASDPVPDENAVMNCLGDGTAGCSPSDLLAVGSRPSGANQWGHLDLAGNLWEWTLDYYDATYYQAVGSCSNCANLANTSPRAIRGGSFTSTMPALRATARASKAGAAGEPYTGFRCAYDP